MNGLDPAGIGELRELIRALVGEGRTVLLSSHLLDEVQRTCDAAAIIDDGRIIAQGTLDELTAGGPRAIDITLHAPRPGRVAAAARCPGVARATEHAGEPARRAEPRGAGRSRDRQRAAAPPARRRLLDRAGQPRRRVARAALPDHDHPPGGSILMFDLRLIAADVLKLRRRRGMLALCVALTLAPIALMVIAAADPARGNPLEHLPAGGVMAYQDMMFALTLMMLVVGAMVGATAGAQDLESGVFRDLAATGRSRIALFGARIPGACVDRPPDRRARRGGRRHRRVHARRRLAHAARRDGRRRDRRRAHHRRAECRGLGRARRADGLQGSRDLHDARVQPRPRSPAVGHRLAWRRTPGDPDQRLVPDRRGTQPGRRDRPLHRDRRGAGVGAAAFAAGAWRTQAREI